MSYIKKLWYIPTEENVDKLDGLRISYIYNIVYAMNYKGKLIYKNIKENFKIKYIIFSTDEPIFYNGKKIGLENRCSHCACGNDRHMIVQFENGNFGYMKIWNDCLTYTMEELNYVMEITNTLKNVIKYCLTDRVRQLYYDSLNNKSKTHSKLCKFLIPDLIDITLSYKVSENPIYKNYPF
jgi:hypothetical protein